MIARVSVGSLAIGLKHRGTENTESLPRQSSVFSVPLCFNLTPTSDNPNRAVNHVVGSGTAAGLNESRSIHRLLRYAVCQAAVAS